MLALYDDFIELHHHFNWNSTEADSNINGKLQESQQLELLQTCIAEQAAGEIN